jgi:hypothetical protein
MDSRWRYKIATNWEAAWAVACAYYQVLTAPSNKTGVAIIYKICLLMFASTV